jgi:tetratricopeptide (TPR) repeat protein
MPEDTTAARGVARCHAESDRVAARSSELRQQFADALDAFSSGDLVRAKNGFSEILTQDAKDQEAQAMLDRVERAIDVRVGELLDQAERFIDGGLLDSAAGLLEKARKLDPGGVAAVQSRLLRARGRRPAPVEQQTRPRDESQAPQTAPPEATPELTARERREAESLYQKGVEAMKENRTQDALRYWELVLSIDPQHSQARNHLKQEYLMRGMDSFAAGSLDEAVTYWEKALTLDPSDEKARGYLERARQQLSRTREILGEGR